MNKSTIARLAIQSGIDLEFFQAGELYKFADALIANFVSEQKPVAKIDMNKRKAMMLDTVIFKTPTIAQLPDVMLYTLEIKE